MGFVSVCKSDQWKTAVAEKSNKLHYDLLACQGKEGFASQHTTMSK
jgi:hypothetical protein